MYASWLGPLLVSLLTGAPDKKVFDFDYQRFRDLFASAQVKLGLKQVFILYQLRHGGPSHDRAVGMRSLAEVKQRGGWLTDNSVKRYEAHARLQQVESRVPSELQAEMMAAPSRLAERLLSSCVPTKALAISRKRVRTKSSNT